jgi:DNA-directed RNA polymerase specialized sigma24 family protein
MAGLAKDAVENLVRQARQGDREAFGRLVAEFHKPLIGYVRARTGLPLGEAEDLVQETWARVLVLMRRSESEGGYDCHKGSYYTFLTQCVAKYAVLQQLGGPTSTRERPVPFGVEREGQTTEPTDRSGSGPDSCLQAAEEIRLRHVTFLELFELVFRCGGYPHQQLTFAFSKLIAGKESRRGIEGTPTSVDSAYGTRPLAALLGDFFHAYMTESRIEDADTLRHLQRSVEPVRGRLGLKVEELFRFDKASLEYLAGLAGRTAGHTRLRDYYSGHQAGPAAAISDWCNKVKNRVQKVLTDGPGACGHCKLRGVPPCNREAK